MLGLIAETTPNSTDVRPLDRESLYQNNVNSLALNLESISSLQQIKIPLVFVIFKS